jgi:hypothetical protein
LKPINSRCITIGGSESTVRRRVIIVRVNFLPVWVRVHHRIPHAVAEAVAVQPRFGRLSVWVCAEELVGALVEDTATHVDEPELWHMLMHAVTTGETGRVVGHDILAPVRRVAAHTPRLVGKLLNLAGSGVHHRCEGVLTVGHRGEKGVLPRSLDIDARQAVTAVKIVNFAVHTIGVDLFLIAVFPLPLNTKATEPPHYGNLLGRHF